jgi:predicted kinase
MVSIIEGNAAGFKEHGSGILGASACTDLTTALKNAVGRLAPLLDRRREGGMVRQCHGDLHLGNIVVLDGRPTLFDGIEFNDDIACVDVLYDLGFLLMDLWHRRLFLQANALFNEYLGQTGDDEGLPLLPLFLSCRAAVRALTSVTAAGMSTEPHHREDLAQNARSYLDLAQTLLRTTPPCLIAVGGFSGSGKSTLARALASGVGSPPGAVVLRSDIIRKRFFGVAEHTRLDPQAYTADASRKIYDRLRVQAQQILAAGQSVIVDAVHAKSEERNAIERVARMAGAPFLGLWLDAPEHVLVERLEGRTMDASDADREVVHRQIQKGAEHIEWHRLDAGPDPDAVCRLARSLIPTGAAV